jgi:hypothetical protein
MRKERSSSGFRICQILRNELTWLDTPLPDREARVIVTVLTTQERAIETTLQHRQPPARLKGTARATSDIVSPLLSEQEWNAMFERAAWQLADNW